MMPEWASRYHIILEKIVCQRIQDITEEDCVKEGCPEIMLKSAKRGVFNAVIPSFWFETLWDSINLKRGYGWSFNPWAWGLYYRVVKK